jgi:hypothetical protein
VLVDFLRTKLGASSLRSGNALHVSALASAPRGPQLENSLRELLYLVLSLPEYQLG